MNAESTNSAMEDLARVTGADSNTLEQISPYDTLQEAVEKFTRNLTKCLESYTENVINDVKRGN